MSPRAAMLPRPCSSFTSWQLQKRASSVRIPWAHLPSTLNTLLPTPFLRAGSLLCPLHKPWNIPTAVHLPFLYTRRGENLDLPL